MHHLRLRDTSCLSKPHTSRTKHTQLGRALDYASHDKRKPLRACRHTCTELTPRTLPDTHQFTNLHDSSGSAGQVLAMQTHPKKMCRPVSYRSPSSSLHAATFPPSTSLASNKIGSCPASDRYLAVLSPAKPAYNNIDIRQSNTFAWVKSRIYAILTQRSHPAALSRDDLHLRVHENELHSRSLRPFKTQAPTVPSSGANPTCACNDYFEGTLWPRSLSQLC